MIMCGLQSVVQNSFSFYPQTHNKLCFVHLMYRVVAVLLCSIQSLLTVILFERKCCSTLTSMYWGVKQQAK